MGKRKHPKPKTATGDESVVKIKTEVPSKSVVKIKPAMAGKSVVKIPVKAADFSANWQNMLKGMATGGSANGKKKRQNIPKKPDIVTNDGEGEKSKIQKHQATSTHRHRPYEKPTSRHSSATTNADNDALLPWFDDVDPMLLDRNDFPGLARLEAEAVGRAGEVVNYGGERAAKADLRRHGELPSNVLAMDCEMVGVGRDALESMLARVSLVNQFGETVYDKFVRPTQEVKDYRTWVSGVRPDDLAKGAEFEVVQREVGELIAGKVLVGHAISQDLDVLHLRHPKHLLRDTARHKPFKAICNGKTPSLKRLTSHLLGIEIQQGEHSSIRDAQAAMRLYTTYRAEWEARIKRRRENKLKIFGKE